MPGPDDPLTPIPLAILTGFLGAGKTSRLNAWLKDPAFADTLVLINEFGEVGLDHLLVEAAPGEVVLLAAGCLCCALRGDLVATLEDLLRRRDNRRIAFFRRLVIETSGLADPLPIIQTILQHPYLSRRFAIAAILALVDAVHGAETLERHAEARRQIATADALILSKADIATPEQIAESRAAMRAINAAAPELDEIAARSPEALMTPRFDPLRMEAGALETWLGPAGATSHAHGIDSFGLIHAEPIGEAQLTVFLSAMRVLHGPRLLRMKGLVALKEDPEHPLAVHQVQSVSHPPVKLARWPGRDRRSRLVFITDGIPRETIETFWKALVAS